MGAGRAARRPPPRRAGRRRRHRGHGTRHGARRGRAAPNTDYLYSVDGGDPRPDPRSAWQPHGVHGPSRTFDAAAHAWGDADWAGLGEDGILGSIVYELHVGTFTPEGTLDAAIGRIDHLVALGVRAVSLMPVAAFPGERGWGYDGVSLYAVHEAYGGPAALQRFVDAAHRAGLAVILDVVYNHLGPAGNYLPVFGPYFTDRYETPWGWAVNLDGPGAFEVRAFILENALRWMADFHLDGLRLDAVHALTDHSPLHVLADLALATGDLEERLGRPLDLVAESDLNDVRMVSAVGAKLPTGPGLGMDAQWTDDVHHALHALFTGETHGYYTDFGSTADLRRVVEGVFRHQGDFSTFRGTDWGAPVPDDVDRRRFVVSSQTHDQVGNRALGDRPARTLTEGQLIGLAALFLLGPFTPMLFQGEEWGTRTPFQYFTDHDPELGAAVSEGRLAEFATHGWEELYGTRITVPDPQDPQTFASSKLSWGEVADPRHARILEAYRELIALRAHPDIASGDAAGTALEIGPDDAWVVLRRDSVDVVVVLTSAPQVVTLGGTRREGGADGDLLFAHGEATLEGGTLTIGGHGVAVVAR